MLHAFGVGAGTDDSFITNYHTLLCLQLILISQAHRVSSHISLILHLRAKRWTSFLEETRITFIAFIYEMNTVGGRQWFWNMPQVLQHHPTLRLPWSGRYGIDILLLSCWPNHSQTYEVAALRAVKSLLPPDSLVTVPEVHLFDEKLNVIIMDDCGPSAQTLKQLLISDPPSKEQLTIIGNALGIFLSTIHQKNIIPEQTMKLFSEYNLSRTIYGYVSYGRIPETLSGKAGIESLSNPTLDVPSEDMAAIEHICAQTIKRINEARNGIFNHGDFWTGYEIINNLTPMQLLNSR